MDLGHGDVVVRVLLARLESTLRDRGLADGALEAILGRHGPVQYMIDFCETEIWADLVRDDALTLRRAKDGRQSRRCRLSDLDR